jgi:excisionase family DNA binding protein
VSDLEQLIRAIVRDEIGKTPANDTEPERVTVDEYARRWSLSPSTVRQAIRDKRLEVFRIGRAIRIAADAKIAKRAGTANERAVLQLMRGGKGR